MSRLYGETKADGRKPRGLPRYNAWIENRRPGKQLGYKNNVL